MKTVHVFLLAVITFCWIWLLPFMILGAFFSIPVFVIGLPICFMISVSLQLYHHNKIIPHHFLRTLMSLIPWHEWFPCNVLYIKQPSVIAVHPHGLLCCGALAGIHFVPGSKTVFCVAPILFYIPILGWFIRVFGCIPAEYPIMLSCLQQGYSIIVVPGGVPELVLAETGDDTRWFQRGGFIRIANQAGVALLSVFVRGECATYTIIEGPCLKGRVHWAWKTNLPLVCPIILGWYGTWMPKRIPLKLELKTMSSTNKQNYYRELKRAIEN